jgi:hypothetical protein
LKTSGLFKTLSKSDFVVISVFMLYFAVSVFIKTGNKELFYDFKTYYYAVQSYKNGVDFYNPEFVFELQQRNLLLNDSALNKNLFEYKLPYVYPPVTVKFFQLFANDNYFTGLLAYNVLKLILLIILILIWKFFIEIDKYFLLFFLLAFNFALSNDFYWGQITLFEQVFLWLGFLMFIRKKYLLFSIFIVLASLFKITPLFFSLLLLFTGDRKKYLYFVLIALLFVLYIGLNYLFDQSLFRIFAQSLFGHFNAERVDGRGLYHPSSYMLIDSVLNALSGGKAYLKNYSIITAGIFFIFACVIVTVSWLALRKLKAVYRDIEVDKLMIYLFCFVYALVNPKFMFYSYILLMIPGFYLIKNSKLIKPIYLLIFILLLSPGDLCFYPGINSFYALYWQYFPLIQAFGLWGLFIAEHKNNKLLQT